MKPAICRGFSLGRNIAVISAMLSIYVAWCFAAPAKEEARAVIFHDTFRPRLGPGWRWIREEPKHWRIGADGLEVHIQPGNMWGPANDAKNLLVRPAPHVKERPIEIVAA